ncbi:MFS transporter [Nibricoccus aquaticus]|uniref:MFS transporter n=1 Tax=Nibricoccus aquaticus TaxID=2576891 RepID=A0A290Q841_9BACT|nr:MFS transporter [Nibricoccus aquaticus]ATC64674.1 MFS transporter [Nibricoccus aquaticus]
MQTTQPAPAGSVIGRYRWRICAVLFLATTINYIDRNVFSFTMLDTAFRHQMLGIPESVPLTDADLAVFKEKMSHLDALFKYAYAFGFLLAGYMIDRLGIRRGYTISIAGWSVAAVGHGLVHGMVGMGAVRIGLGLGEAGNFPAAIKTVSEWFPKKERSFATGLFNAGANVGIILTAVCVPWIISHWGWRASFIITGAIGTFVLFWWLAVYRKPEEHPKLSAAELAYIRQDGGATSEKPMKWSQIGRYRATWAFAIPKFMTDAIWWFYLTWLPTFFNENAAFDTKLDLKQVGLPFLIIYLVSDGGSIFFGWLATRFIGLGWSVNKARKVTMLICALCVVPIVFASMTSSIVVAIALISLATAAHQGWSANLFTTVSDQFPRRAVGSVVGIGGLMGGLGGALLAGNVGAIINTGGYVPLFTIAASAYLLALVILHTLSPKLETITIADDPVAKA